MSDYSTLIILGAILICGAIWNVLWHYIIKFVGKLSERKIQWEILGAWMKRNLLLIIVLLTATAAYAILNRYESAGGHLVLDKWTGKIEIGH